MRRVFVPFPLTPPTVRLTGQLAHRLLRVLRLGVGDAAILFDPRGTAWKAVVTVTERDAVQLHLCEPLENDREVPISVHLFQAIAKGERMDLVVQKATELGVARIVPMVTRRTVVQLSADRAETKRHRWQRVAQAAAEQCGAQRIPTVDAPVSFQRAVLDAAQADVWLLFYEGAEEPLKAVLAEHAHASRIAVMVGPEGGFDPDEVMSAQERGARIVSLGKRILRAETAAIVAVALVLYELGALEHSPPRVGACHDKDSAATAR